MNPKYYKFEKEFYSKSENIGHSSNKCKQEYFNLYLKEKFISFIDSLSQDQLDYFMEFNSEYFDFEVMYDEVLGINI